MVQLRDILGKPGEGFHVHVGGVAILDVVATLIAGGLVGWWMWDGQSVFDLAAYIAFATFNLFVLGEALHLLIGVETVVAKWIKNLR